MAQTSPNLFLASSVSFVMDSMAERVMKVARNKQLVFIPTAAEVEKGSLSWLHADKQALVDHGFEVNDYTITGKTQKQVQERLQEAGVVCVSGGNTYYLLDQVRKSGFDMVIRHLVSLGMPYIGSSAGSVLAGPNIETRLDDPHIAPNLKDYKGLALTDVVILPHWGSPYFKKDYQMEMKTLYGVEQKMVFLTDYQYLHVQGESYQIISVKE